MCDRRPQRAGPLLDGAGQSEQGPRQTHDEEQVPQPGVRLDSSAAFDSPKVEDEKSDARRLALRHTCQGLLAGVGEMPACRHRVLWTRCRPEGFPN